MRNFQSPAPRVNMEEGWGSAVLQSWTPFEIQDLCLDDLLAIMVDLTLPCNTFPCISVLLHQDSVPQTWRHPQLWHKPLQVKPLQTPRTHRHESDKTELFCDKVFRSFCFEKIAI